MKEYFYGQTVPQEDETGRRLYQFRLGALLTILIILLAGCATPAEPETHVCFMKLLGHTEQGYSVVTQQCMTPEAFAESQK
jgi:hypothetical protein